MIRRIKNLISKYLLFVRFGAERQIVVVDDYIPNLGSNWRALEFDAIFKEFPNSVLVSTNQNVRNLNYKNTKYNNEISKFILHYSHLKNKIKTLSLFTNLNSKLVYCLFYNNIKYLFPYFQRLKISFAFTLYPGGGFVFNNEKIDNDLFLIINSPLCKVVFVNQEHVKKYLVEKLNIKEDKVKLIFGVPFSIENDENVKSKRNSKQLNCVFIGNKYTIAGVDKGFDVFQQVAYQLMDDINFKFHVIGPFTEDDLLIEGLKGSITFHNSLYEQELSDCLKKMDIVISPNRRYVLKPGAFDGFPLGASLEAAKNGCCMLLTNPFNEGEDYFVHQKNYIKIESDAMDIRKWLLYLKENENKRVEIAKNCNEIISEIYSFDNQIGERIKILKSILTNEN